MKAKNTSSVDADEIAHFTHMADEWWDETGKFAPLHRMNPVRIGYIREMLAEHFRGQGSGVRDQKTPSPNPQSLPPISLLDIGCGGGLIAEPMARLGARVTAIDAGEKNIAVASHHAQQSGLSIDYRCTTAEDLAATDAQFDVVLALEMLEHVADLPLLVQSACALVKPGGLLLFSTLNRTAKSYTLAILGAEYVLRWLPVGTHHWKKFIRPSELYNLLEQQQMQQIALMGMTLHPLTWKWRLNAHDLDVNYLISASKPISSCG